MTNIKKIRNRLKYKCCFFDELAFFRSIDIKKYSLLVNRISKQLMINFCFLVFVFNSYGQDNYLEKKQSQIFSLSPISKKVDKVNGFVFGVGHYPNAKVSKQTINGINVDVNPIGLLVPFGVFYLPEIIKKSNQAKINNDSIVFFSAYESKSVVQMNGLNLSTGAFITSVSQNGLNISLMNKFYKFNGLTVNAIGIQSNRLNGCSISIYNGINTLNGFGLGVFNESNYLNGIQLGMYNFSTKNNGIQVGVFNMTKSKGFQIGLWNINAKRSMPFVNW